jgi:uncharacterized protein YjbI with pentapeptide repeats
MSFNIEHIQGIESRWQPVLFTKTEKPGKQKFEWIFCANFTRTNLTGVNLEGANLSEVDFAHANLGNACLKDADLDETAFCAANMLGAEININVPYFNNYANTIVPDGSVEYAPSTHQHG